MRRRQIIFAAVSLGVVLSLYVGTFSYWWLRSPSTLETWQGKQVRVVKFQFNSVSWHTEPLWSPAFWFVERVCGYEAGGFAAMEHQSVQLYSKTSR